VRFRLPSMLKETSQKSSKLRIRWVRVRTKARPRPNPGDYRVEPVEVTAWWRITSSYMGAR